MGTNKSMGVGQTAVNTPPQLYGTASATQGLAEYASNLLNPIASMTNWASQLATGGQAQQIPSYQAVASLPVAEHVFSGGPFPWQGTFSPITGEITWSLAHGNTSRQFSQGFQQAYQEGNISQGQYEQYLDAYNQALRQKTATATGGGGSTATPRPGASAQSLSAQLGPFLGQAWQAIQEQQQLTGEMPALQMDTAAATARAEQEAQTLGTEAETLYGQGESMLTQATTGTGLYPSQEAYVEQAKQTGETEAASELGAMGLSQSTQAGQLKEQADLSAAATAGQLVQGNITAAQAQINAAANYRNLQQSAEKIAQGGQTLSLAEQQALAGEFQSIATQSAGLQKQLWDQAMAGYGIIGSMLQAAGQQYGLNIQAYDEVIKAETAQANQQASKDIQQSQAAVELAGQAVSVVNSVIGAIGKIGAGGIGGGGGGA